MIPGRTGGRGDSLAAGTRTREKQQTGPEAGLSPEVWSGAARADPTTTAAPSVAEQLADGDVLVEELMGAGLEQDVAVVVEDEAADIERIHPAVDDDLLR